MQVSAKCVAVLCLGCVLPVLAEEAVSPAVGDDLTLKIPLSLFDIDVGWSLKYTAKITSLDGGVVVNGNTDWRVAGFPSMLAGSVAKVRRKKSMDLTEVILRTTDGKKMILSFPGQSPGDIHQMLGAVACVGRPTSRCATSYLDQAYRRLAEHMFTGDLADLTESQKLALIRFAHIAASGTRVASETFKERFYLVVDLGSDVHVYNTLQLDQSQRVARVINQRLLVILKAFATPVKESPIIHGLKIEIRIPFKNFTEQYAAPQYDRLELYVPSDLIRQFAEVEIPSQDLIDGAIVIVNTNRIAVPLAG